VGATGYTGVELLRLLAGHPEVDIATITSRSEAGKRVDVLFPNLRGVLDLRFSEPQLDTLGECNVVFFATPNGTAMQLVPEILAAGVKVIDLAADFRLKDPEIWQRWYGMPHACAELLSEAVYGLPEVNRAAIQCARLVANPGCYPTAIVLGFLPLIESGNIDLNDLIADAKSGVSGAGRAAKVDTLLCEAGESFKAYGVAGHRHYPEILQALEQIAQTEIGLSFVPHLVPMIRGIHATLYANALNEDVDWQVLFDNRYAAEPFVDVLPSGSHPETRSVRGINTCRLAVHQPFSGRKIVVLSVIDNLVKGAAGQAIQNMNLMCNFDETMGLGTTALVP
jgi:N-acetyl-gamma-glutamyl-phosphate reductase